MKRTLAAALAALTYATMHQRALLVDVLRIIREGS